MLEVSESPIGRQHSEMHDLGRKPVYSAQKKRPKMGKISVLRLNYNLVKDKFKIHHNCSSIHSINSFKCSPYYIFTGKKEKQSMADNYSRTQVRLMETMFE